MVLASYTDTMGPSGQRSSSVPDVLPALPSASTYSILTCRESHVEGSKPLEARSGSGGSALVAGVVIISVMNLPSVSSSLSRDLLLYPLVESRPAGVPPRAGFGNPGSPRPKPAPADVVETDLRTVLPRENHVVG